MRQMQRIADQCYSPTRKENLVKQTYSVKQDSTVESMYPYMI